MVGGIRHALHLIFTADLDVVEIALRSVKVSSMAALLAALWSLPMGILLGMFDFLGRDVLKGLFNGLIGVPTVILGLILYLILAPAGPLGFLGLMYTEMGISLGQAILITPLIVSLVANSIELIGKDVKELAVTLGAGRVEASLTVLRECISGVTLAMIAGFNRAIGELGIAIMIGGNVFVRGSGLNTRVLTTAIQMHTTRGEIDIAIALGIILLTIVIIISVASNIMRNRWIGT